MIRTDKEYRSSRQRLADARQFLSDQTEELARGGLTHDEVAKATSPLRSFLANIEDDVLWYARARGGDIEQNTNLIGIGRSIIAARIAGGLSQRKLAKLLKVSEAQVSRDERNEYHGISTDRAHRILDALGADTEVTVRLRSSGSKVRITGATTSLSRLTTGLVSNHGSATADAGARRFAMTDVFIGGSYRQVKVEPAVHGGVTLKLLSDGLARAA